MESGFIDIKIGKEDQVRPTPDEGVTREEPGKVSVQHQAVNAALIATGKTMIMQGVKSVGEVSGDYATTSMVDTAIGFGADLMMFGVGPVGWVGVGAKVASQLLASEVAMINSNRSIDLMRSRMGIVSVRGSRYGD